MSDRISNETKSVGTSAVVVASELLYGQRKSISIQNTSTNGAKISLSINDDPSNGKGFVMSPGGNYSDSTDGINYPSNYQYAVVSDIAGGSVAVQERIGKEVK